MAVVWNIPIACNRSSADFMISSPLRDGEYDRLVPDYEAYRHRPVAGLEGATRTSDMNRQPGGGQSDD
jgi:methylglyoxal synthase